MAKTRGDEKTLINIFNWAFNIIDNQDLTDSQQLTFLHLIHRLNRNLWEPIKISESKLAGAMNKDRRTVGTAINQLLKLEIISKNSKGEINIEFKPNPIYRNDAKTDSRNQGEKPKQAEKSNPRRSEPSDGIGENFKPSYSELGDLEIFTSSDT